MFFKWFSVTFLAAQLLATAHASDLKADLIPVNIGFGEIVTDDVNNGRALAVYISAKNIGNRATRRATWTEAQFQGGRYRTYVYGPSSRGGVLADWIHPGETGLMVFYMPLGSLRHCQKVSLQIDVLSALQFGTGVFTNDYKTTFIQKSGEVRLCRPSDRLPSPR